MRDHSRDAHPFADGRLPQVGDFQDPSAGQFAAKKLRGIGPGRDSGAGNVRDRGLLLGHLVEGRGGADALGSWKGRLIPAFSLNSFVGEGLSRPYSLAPAHSEGPQSPRGGECLELPPPQPGAPGHVCRVGERRIPAGLQNPGNRCGAEAPNGIEAEAHFQVPMGIDEPRRSRGAVAALGFIAFRFGSFSVAFRTVALCGIAFPHARLA